jgi:hypothetical protein
VIVETEIQKAKRLISELISVINSLPISWEEFVGEDLAEEINEFLDSERI